MAFISRLYTLIDRGAKGLNLGLSMGLPRFETIVDGIQRSTYTVLAGGTGSGKTTLALYSYVYRPLVDNIARGRDKRVKILYFSLEMSAEILLAKLLSLHLYEVYNVELSFKQIISKQDILSEEDHTLIKSCEGWLEDICQDLIIYDRVLTADMFYGIIQHYSEQNGYWDIDDDGNDRYTAYDPEEIIEIIIDHMGLIRKTSGRTKKEEIDLTSNHIIYFRNHCGYSALGLFQINRTSSSMDRRKAEMSEIQLDDIKDTGGPSEDAELVIAIFNPWREKVGRYKGYNISILQSKFRALQVLKNRLGEADKSIGVSFFGSIGMWRELPLGRDMEHLSEAEHQRYLTLDLNAAETATAEQSPPTEGFVYRF